MSDTPEAVALNAFFAACKDQGMSGESMGEALRELARLDCERELSAANARAEQLAQELAAANERIATTKYDADVQVRKWQSIAAENRDRAAKAEQQLATVTAERDAMQFALKLNGFVRCDIPACNCGSWHPRYGLHERMQEIKDELAESGHPLCNENGNLTLNALRELVAEKDAAVKDQERYVYLRDLMTRNLPETWKKVEEIAAIGCYTSWDEFDNCIDAALSKDKA